MRFFFQPTRDLSQAWKKKRNKKTNQVHDHWGKVHSTWFICCLNWIVLEWIRLGLRLGPGSGPGCSYFGIVNQRTTGDAISMTWLTFHEPARDIHLPPSPGQARPFQNQNQKKEQRTMAWESVKVIDNHLPAADWWSPADNSQNDKLRRHVNHQEESASESESASRQSPVVLWRPSQDCLQLDDGFRFLIDWLTDWLTAGPTDSLTGISSSSIVPQKLITIECECDRKRFAFY